MPNSCTDWMLRAMNQIIRTKNRSSQTHAGPNAHAVMNIPAMATPMHTWAMSTSHPDMRRSFTDTIRRVRQ